MALGTPKMDKLKIATRLGVVDNESSISNLKIGLKLPRAKKGQGSSRYRVATGVEISQLPLLKGKKVFMYSVCVINFSEHVVFTSLYNFRHPSCRPN